MDSKKIMLVQIDQFPTLLDFFKRACCTENIPQSTIESLLEILQEKKKYLVEEINLISLESQFILKSDSSLLSSLENHQKLDVFLEKLIQMVDEDNELQQQFEAQIG